MTNQERPTVKNAVNIAFQKITINQEFSGTEFKRMCVRECPNLKRKYVETFLRLLRYEHRAEFVCINRHDSKFRRVS